MERIKQRSAGCLASGKQYSFWLENKDRMNGSLCTFLNVKEYSSLFHSLSLLYADLICCGWVQVSFSWLFEAHLSCAETLLVPMCSVDYQIRLSPLTQCSGRVEVSSNNDWKALCDEGWGVLDAVVACRQLGCGSPLNTSNWNHSDPRTDRRLGCLGQENSLDECPKHTGSGVHSCKTQEATVTCSGDWGDVHTKIQKSEIYLIQDQTRQRILIPTLSYEKTCC